MVLGLVQKVTQSVLGTPGEDLFADPENVPDLFRNSRTNMRQKTVSVGAYSAFVQLFNKEQNLADLAANVQRVNLLKALVQDTPDPFAVEVVANEFVQKHNNELPKLLVDFGRLNALLSFDNTNLVSIFRNGPKRNTAESPTLLTMHNTFLQLKNDLAFVSGDGSDANSFASKLNGFKDSETTESNKTKYNDVVTAIQETNNKQKLSDALTEVTKVSDALTALLADLHTINDKIHQGNGLSGLMQMLSSVESAKTRVKTIQDTMLVKDTTDASKSKVEKLVEDALALLKVDGAVGLKLKELAAVVSSHAQKTEIDKLFKFDTNNSQYEGDSFIESLSAITITGSGGR